MRLIPVVRALRKLSRDHDGVKYRSWLGTTYPAENQCSNGPASRCGSTVGHLLLQTIRWTYGAKVGIERVGQLRATCAFVIAPGVPCGDSKGSRKKSSGEPAHKRTTRLAELGLVVHIFATPKIASNCFHCEPLAEASFTANYFAAQRSLTIETRGEFCRRFDVNSLCRRQRNIQEWRINLADLHTSAFGCSAGAEIAV